MSEFYDTPNIPEPPKDLNHRVMRRVIATKRRALALKAAGFGSLFAGSLALLAFAYMNLTAALTQSGFLSFASLFFSDFNVAMANFQDFMFSILESFPVFSAAFLVGGLIAVIWSATHLLRDIVEIKAHRGTVAAT